MASPQRDLRTDQRKEGARSQRAGRRRRADLRRDVPDKRIARGTASPTLISRASHTRRASPGCWNRCRRERERLQSMLSYPEDSVGGLMNMDQIAVRATIGIGTLLRYLQLREDLPPNTDKLFVVDRKQHYRGILRTRRVLTARPETTVSGVGGPAERRGGPPRHGGGSQLGPGGRRERPCSSIRGRHPAAHAPTRHRPRPSR